MVVFLTVKLGLLEKVTTELFQNAGAFHPPQLVRSLQPLREQRW